MARDLDGPVVEAESMRDFASVGRTPVRASLFARVEGMLLVADAARPARASLTASYEGTMTLLGTPGATVVTAALAQAGDAVVGTMTLKMPDPGAAGTYVVEGRVRDGRFVLRGSNGLGARLRWQGTLADDGAVHGPVRLVAGGSRMAGMLTLAPTSAPGSCGSGYFAGTVAVQPAPPAGEAARPPVACADAA